MESVKVHEGTLAKRSPYEIPTSADWYPTSSVFYHPLQAGSIDGTDVVPHDNGVVRAVLSSYRPNALVKGDPYKTLFVGRLDKTTKEDKVKGLFEQYGVIKRFRLVRDLLTGFSRGYAFVEFERERDARSACRDANRAVVDGREILVDYECERNLKGWKPRRFGGGFGGNKESGQLRFGGKGRPFRRPIDLSKNPLNHSLNREMGHGSYRERFNSRENNGRWQPGSNTQHRR